MKWVLALVLMGSTAGAQDLPYSDAATLQCLQTASDFTAKEACIGRSADICMQTPAGGSTVGMSGCMDAELRLWDGMLNTNYRDRMAAAKQADIDNAVAQYNLPSQAEALRDMQRAWIAFRDAACAYERSQWGGGTGGGPATYACLLEMTGRQALVLADTGW